MPAEQGFESFISQILERSAANSCLSTSKYCSNLPRPESNSHSQSCKARSWLPVGHSSSPTSSRSSPCLGVSSTSPSSWYSCSAEAAGALSDSSPHTPSELFPAASAEQEYQEDGLVF